MKIIVANWKMNHAFDEADIWMDGFFKKFAEKYEELRKSEIVLCPPAILLDYIDSELMGDGLQALEKIIQSENKKFEDFSPDELNEILVKQRPFRLGGQNCHHQVSGSFTGDISASMLAKVGCEYVIIGHSERRGASLESDALIAEKAKSALAAKLTPIICVGESKETRDQGQHLDFIANQLINSIPQNVNFNKMVIAYEPIWSIGTGILPSASQIAEMAELIKKIFAEKFSDCAKEFFILYGGSVTSQNSQEILSVNGIGGLLVGKASLDAEEFVKICTS